MATSSERRSNADSSSNSAISKPVKPRFSLIQLMTNNNTSQRPHKSRKSSSRKSKSRSADVESNAAVAVTAGECSNPPAASSAVTMTTSVTSVSRSDSVTVRVRRSSTGVDLRECPLCYDEFPVSEYPDLLLQCNHKSCAACMAEYLKIEIGESRIDISCPECSERIHPTDIQKLLKSDTHMNKYEQFMVRRVLVRDPDTRWCPAPDCGYAVIASGCAGCPMLHCERPGCNTSFCYHCKQPWHADQTCDAARLERFPLRRLSLSDARALVTAAEEYKLCPRCKTMINKMDDGSCNHMTCSICGAQFCWLCLKEASDLHYLSPSGCTFWGKKPWSKKKKILWQLGTLVGAPIGIALIAGLSVPVLVFGLPIWAGRKLYQRYKLFNKHKRNTIVALGTIGAFMISPVIAGVTIAIGVPVMLAYVYGVVPYSLCRGGTCGVKSDNGTFSFDFSPNADNSSGMVRGLDAGSFLVANPSIGPSIGEASLGAGFGLSASGIQMDKVGLTDVDSQQDTKSASMKNMAGTSITEASLAGSLCEPPPSTQDTFQKLEIRADVMNRPALSALSSSTKSVERKNSIDSTTTLSQADTRSLRSYTGTGGPYSDTRSHVSFSVDNASVKALAGSICAPRDKDGVSVVNPQELASAADVRSKSCIRGDNGSPVSNRSVSFAACDEISNTRLSKKQKKRRDKLKEMERAERLSLRSLDTISNSSGDQLPPSKRLSEHVKTRASADGLSLSLTAVVDKSNLSSDHLTEVDIDKPQYSTLVIKKTIHVGGGNSTSLTEGKVLCNILEDKRLDNRDSLSAPVSGRLRTDL